MTNQFKLVEGKFTVGEASEILNNLFRNKLQFHAMKNMSSQERFGIDDLVAVKRIQELKSDIEILSKLLQEANAENQLINIESTVKLTFTNK